MASGEPLTPEARAAVERLLEVGADADLVAALREARPYVFNQTRRNDGVEDWRTETARRVLARVDAVLARHESIQR